MLRVGALGMLLLSLAGCPRKAGTPDPLGDAVACETLADCNEGRTCGQLKACAGGYCAAQASLDIVCQ